VFLTRAYNIVEETKYDNPKQKKNCCQSVDIAAIRRIAVQSRSGQILETLSQINLSQENGW
jgi:hypothetical protein